MRTPDLRLELEVLNTIRAIPGISKLQICRVVNGRWRYFCGNYQCFANSRQRGQGRNEPCPCRFPKSTTLAYISRLEEQGLIQVRVEKKPDGKNCRGWDFFHCCYLCGEMDPHWDPEAIGEFMDPTPGSPTGEYYDGDGYYHLQPGGWEEA